MKPYKIQIWTKDILSWETIIVTKYSWIAIELALVEFRNIYLRTLDVTKITS